MMKNRKIEDIPVKKIVDSPWQGRLLSVESKDRDIVSQIREIKKSIKENGILQPVTVRKNGSKYELIDGHRRVLAAKELGLLKVPAIITEVDDREAQIASIVSNIERKNLHPIEKALAYQKILDAGIFTTRTELAKALGKSKAYIGEILNNLELDTRIIEDLSKNRNITDNRILRAVRKFSKVDKLGKSDRQWELYNRIIRENLTRAQVLEIIKNEKSMTIIRKKPVTRKETEKEMTIVISKNGLDDEKISELNAILDEFIKNNMVE
jgi:ParB family transcriptional regulator, chromosome partitioning protein